MTERRILTLVRHAKSSWGNPGMSDIDRPLNERGLRDSPRMAEWLASNILKPDLILSSPAQRARTTAEALAVACDIPASAIRYEDYIYYQGRTAWLEGIQHLNDSLVSVVLVGHNPTISDLGTHLLGEGHLSFPTCAICSLEFPIESWALALGRQAKMLAYQAPKMLED